MQCVSRGVRGAKCVQVCAGKRKIVEITPDKPTDGCPAGRETLRVHKHINTHIHTQNGKQILASPSLRTTTWEPNEINHIIGGCGVCMCVSVESIRVSVCVCVE